MKQAERKANAKYTGKRESGTLEKGDCTAGVWQRSRGWGASRAHFYLVLSGMKFQDGRNYVCWLFQCLQHPE
jgi:hypothetical protein